MNVALIAVALAWVGALLGAAWSDWRSLTIPNWFALVLLLLFPLSMVIQGVPENWVQHLLHFAVALTAGMALFALRWFGGGDAKLYAAAALWYDWSGAVPLLLGVVLSGLFLAIGFLLARMARVARGKEGGGMTSIRKGERRIPYGIAIAAGAILSSSWLTGGLVNRALNLG